VEVIPVSGRQLLLLWTVVGGAALWLNLSASRQLVGYQSVTSADWEREQDQDLETKVRRDARGELARTLGRPPGEPLSPQEADSLRAIESRRRAQVRGALAVRREDLRHALDRLRLREALSWLLTGGLLLLSWGYFRKRKPA
jgi:hypothetical protein